MSNLAEVLTRISEAKKELCELRCKMRPKDYSVFAKKRREIARMSTLAQKLKIGAENA